MKLYRGIIGLLALSLCLAVFASEEHDHDHEHGHSHDEPQTTGVLAPKHDNLDGHDDHHEAHEEGHGGDHQEGHDHDHDHGGTKAIGQNKAIVEVDEKKGLKLSSSALKNLGIKLISIGGEVIVVDRDVMVKSKDHVGLYRFKDGFFKFFEGEVLHNDKKTKKIKLRVKGLKRGDQIVMKGVSLLRVADIYSTDKSEYGHAH
ncbi:hypothetical protein [Bacteriovorax sp. DB6_IX]|uniref:hypothetical protein n=1 Tax=Bacteriovorax sp. DB6_IX TaxID=1353530 RepID=UPI00038A0C06|nr:hypothetical protein [Bacteriovorax sp. DB6_IX]EQC49270.1 hypothetical protein M901_2784 [Bacteriovorax sp. DB6_IX]